MQVFTNEALSLLAFHHDVWGAVEVYDTVELVVGDEMYTVDALMMDQAANAILDAISYYDAYDYFRQVVEPRLFELEDYLENHTMFDYLYHDMFLWNTFMEEFKLDGIDEWVPENTKELIVIGYCYEEVDNYYGHRLIEPMPVIMMNRDEFVKWCLKHWL